MKYKRIIVNRKRHLELVEEDLPNPRSGEVRLQMLAAGVSLPDVMMRVGGPEYSSTRKHSEQLNFLTVFANSPTDILSQRRFCASTWEKTPTV